MSGTVKRSITWILLSVLTGCSAATTRFPTFRAQPADREVSSYTAHDPFPDENAGPETFTRPRVFSEPRTDSTKFYLQRYQQAAYGYPRTLYSWGSPPSVLATQFPPRPTWTAQPTAADFNLAPVGQY